MAHRVLLVEGEDEIASPFVHTLGREGYVVDQASTGRDTIAAASRATYKSSSSLAKDQTAPASLANLSNYRGLQRWVYLTIWSGDQFLRHQKNRRQNQRIDNGCSSHAVGETVVPAQTIDP